MNDEHIVDHEKLIGSTSEAIGKNALEAIKKDFGEAALGVDGRDLKDRTQIEPEITKSDERKQSKVRESYQPLRYLPVLFPFIYYRKHSQCLISRRIIDSSM